MAEEIRKVLSASTLEGDNVVNAQGENLGHIKDLMIDLERGQIAYAVLSFGGFMGMGDKLFAIPFSALQVDERNERVVLNVDKERLKNAPGFDKDQWPDMSLDSDYSRSLHQFYGTQPYHRRTT